MLAGFVNQCAAWQAVGELLGVLLLVGALVGGLWTGCWGSFPPDCHTGWSATWKLSGGLLRIFADFVMI